MRTLVCLQIAKLVVGIYSMFISINMLVFKIVGLIQFVWSYFEWLYK